MSLHDSAASARIEHLKSSAEALKTNKRYVNAVVGFFKALVLCGGPTGSTRMIVYNSVLLLTTFIGLFQMFPEGKNFQTRRMMIENSPIQTWNQVHDFVSFWKFYDDFLIKAYESNTDVRFRIFFFFIFFFITIGYISMCACTMCRADVVCLLFFFSCLFLFLICIFLLSLSSFAICT